ncbi:hypothetical protein BpHYR1_050179 [Brachionus plicatilis]|uniref:Transmembrane protein n=1 Tax=Brachionus plicatilis TaxID=10195 RepID=A0A3M7S0Z9_BRAPC|nr:hypothetical protein BpHYR1_050179 [Brachionus plicatilis]
MQHGKLEIQEAGKRSIQFQQELIFVKIKYLFLNQKLTLFLFLIIFFECINIIFFSLLCCLRKKFQNASPKMVMASSFFTLLTPLRNEIKIFKKSIKNQCCINYSAEIEVKFYLNHSNLSEYSLNELYQFPQRQKIKANVNKGFNYVKKSGKDECIINNKSGWFWRKLNFVLLKIKIGTGTQEKSSRKHYKLNI